MFTQPTTIVEWIAEFNAITENFIVSIHLRIVHGK